MILQLMGNWIGGLMISTTIIHAYRWYNGQIMPKRSYVKSGVYAKRKKKSKLTRKPTKVLEEIN